MEDILERCPSPIARWRSLRMNAPAKSNHSGSLEREMPIPGKEELEGHSRQKLLFTSLRSLKTTMSVIDHWDTKSRIYTP